ncbi:MAG: maleate cis-trans isomerase family protein [Hyphomicrobiaceae bacterium]
MTDRYGPRGVIALHVPRQNANMQPEYELLRPTGISNQIYRIDLGRPDNVAEATLDVIEHCLGCHPDVVVVGNSIEMRNWSMERHAAFRTALQAKIGERPLVLAGDATVAALRAVGAHKIAMLSPMDSHHANSARSFYEANGFRVVSDHCIGVSLPQNIIRVTDEEIVSAFEAIDLPEADTLLHVGGALSTLPLVKKLEAKHSKPIVTVNAATYWMAMRRLGVSDKIEGFGRLLELPLSTEEVT